MQGKTMQDLDRNDWALRDPDAFDRACDGMIQGIRIVNIKLTRLEKKRVRVYARLDVVLEQRSIDIVRSFDIARFNSVKNDDVAEASVEPYPNFCQVVHDA
jgi:hypothetical protein